MMCCSAAAELAFEGGDVRWGIRASDGAIEKVIIDPNTLDVRLMTIHERKPIGICGSGFISAVAKLLRPGCLLHRGNFNENIRSARLRQCQAGMEFVLSCKEDNSTGHEIIITLKDIAELQIAKAAIRAGIPILMDSIGEDIQRIYLAGAGVNYIDSVDAQTIDLISSLPDCCIIGCGNVTGHGACLALVDMKMKGYAENIAQKLQYLELAGSARFQNMFVLHMFLPQAIDSQATRPTNPPLLLEAMTLSN